MKIVPLPTPIKRGEIELTKVTMREPKGGELRGLETVAILRMDYTAHRTLIPRICPELTANDVDAMDPKNLLEVQQAVVGFFVE